jgi:hypothetical protein
VTQRLGAYEATHDQYVELKVKEQQMLNQFGPPAPGVDLPTQPDRNGESAADAGVVHVAWRKRSRAKRRCARDMIDIFLDLMDRKIEMLSLEEQSLKDSPDRTTGRNHRSWHWLSKS